MRRAIQSALLPPRPKRRWNGAATTALKPTMRDLGRNGTYLVFRQLAQDVAKFCHFLDEATRTARRAIGSSGQRPPGGEDVLDVGRMARR